MTVFAVPRSIAMSPVAARADSGRQRDRRAPPPSRAMRLGSQTRPAGARRERALAADSGLRGCGLAALAACRLLLLRRPALLRRALARAAAAGLLAAARGRPLGVRDRRSATLAHALLLEPFVLLVVLDAGTVIFRHEHGLPAAKVRLSAWLVSRRWGRRSARRGSRRSSCSSTSSSSSRSRS